VTPDIDAVTALLVEAGRTEILPRFRQLRAGDVETKSGPQDLVTAADVAAEAFLTARLSALMPRASIVGEEAVAHDGRFLDALHEPGYVWIIDPLDGTFNFAHGKEEFAIIVALVRDGVQVGGWIHVPLQGKTVVAERGQGTYCEGRRLQVAPPAALHEMRSALYASRTKHPDLYARIQVLRPRLGRGSFARSAGLEYVKLAEGRVHFALFTRQLPWDHAAGALIHAEAGGHGAYLDGTRYRPVDEAKPLLLAPDEPTWRELARLLHPDAGEA
jgi:fructose-1,6-bisphosphatase/inositol monophosphatase family enzyme